MLGHLYVCLHRTQILAQSTPPPNCQVTLLPQRHLAQVVAENKRVGWKELAHWLVLLLLPPNQVITRQQGAHYGTLPPCSQQH